jgi:hypothetical protein
MGLGKTIELIDLMLMHPRPLSEYDGLVPVNENFLIPSKATVIITPPTIRQLPLAYKADLQSPSGQGNSPKELHPCVFLFTPGSKTWPKTLRMNSC